MSYVLSFRSCFSYKIHQSFIYSGYKRFSDKQSDDYSVVPQKPIKTVIDEQKLPSAPKIDLKTIQLLEKLSLVDFANRDGISRLEATIRVADHLMLIDAEAMEPMYSVLEESSLKLSEDEVLEDNMKDGLLNCAADTFEDYFVVPPGNINYVPDEEYYKRLKGK